MPFAKTPVYFFTRDAAQYWRHKNNLYQCPCWSTFGAKPDDAGLKIIQAHRDIHFYRLGKLKKGSALHLETIKGRKTYEVEYTEILTPAEAEIKIQHAAHRDCLLLMTCYPFRYIGPAPKRYLVWAKPQRIITATNCHDTR